MRNKDTRLIFIVILLIILAWLIFRFLGSIPFWVWVLVIGILTYLNWKNIKRYLEKL